MMKKMILILLMVVATFATQSKIVYLRLISPVPEGREFYVGEKVKLKYSLLLFSGASLMDVEFIPNKNLALAQGIKILNPNSNWVGMGDESYENTFIYKIQSTHFAFPALRVMAISQDGKYIDQDEVKGKKYEAIALNGQGYSHVLGRGMEVLDIKARKYDEWNNIVVFNLSVQGGNLEDFKLKGFERQGFNGEITQQGENQLGLYYCVIPSSLKDLKFTYFNLQTLRYEEKSLPIVIEHDQVSTQSDLEPKNNFLIFGNLLIFMCAVILFSLAFYFRKNQKILGVCLILGGALFVLWLFEIFGSKEVVLKPNAQITILPTQNSTLMQSFNGEMRAEVIGDHGKFYKIKFENSKIGWVKKDDCQ